MVAARFVVAVPDVFELFGLDADAVVDDLAVDRPAPAAYVDEDLLVCAAVFDCVRQQVRYDLLDALFIAPDDDLVSAVERYIIALVDDEYLIRSEDAFYCGLQIEGAHIERQRSGLHCRKGEHVADELVQSVGFFYDDLQMIVPLFGVVSRKVAYHLCV